jgi:hypothetical protein
MTAGSGALSLNNIFSHLCGSTAAAYVDNGAS